MTSPKLALFAVLAVILAGGVAVWNGRLHSKTGNPHDHDHHELHETSTVAPGLKTIVYRGENYVLSPEKPDYTDEQAAKIEQIILTDKAPVRSPTYQGLIDYLNTLEAPGYGSSTGGFGDQTTLGQITYISIQLPKKLEFRVITYRANQPNVDYIYVDGFLIKYPYPPAFELSAEGDELIYRDEKNHQVLRKIKLPNRIPKV